MSYATNIDEKQYILSLIYNRRGNQFKYIVKSLLDWNTGILTREYLSVEIVKLIEEEIKRYCDSKSFEDVARRNKMTLIVKNALLRSLKNSTWSTYFDDEQFMNFFIEKYDSIVKNFTLSDFLEERNSNFSIKTEYFGQVLSDSVEYRMFAYAMILGAQFFCKKDFSTLEDFKRIEGDNKHPFARRIF